MIVGAGPAGIATSACLNLLSIPNIVLEREDCYASLWQKKAYDRLKLHLAKNFVNFLICHFLCLHPHLYQKIYPLYQRSVESAWYDKSAQKWVVTAQNNVSGLVEEYVSEFLVVATGENSEGFIPNVYGLDTFKGLVIHSSEYENGKTFGDKDVLVIHVLNKELVQLGMYFLKYIRCTIVDKMVLVLSKLLYGDLGRFGIQRPFKGPFLLKKETGRSPVIDVGTISKIKTGDIKRQFDAIVFATGFKSTIRKWLKEDGGLFNEKGMPKHKSPNHWKGENGLYCVGFASAGLFGISNDAKNIANDIFRIIDGK
ncbi:putative indole-3-pyruvate monooxygenase [Helianthus annuus]|nr:putative indole-3-pyruvate monooxygenase [Helianthus annuus]